MTSTRNHVFSRHRMAIAVLAICLGAGVRSTFSQTNQISGIKDALLLPSAVKRDPFWPVGYVPKNVAKIVPAENPKPGTPQVDNSWNEAEKKVTITGVSSRANNEYFAVINGEVKSVGDTVAMTHGGTVYTWVFDGIEPSGKARLRRVSAK